MGCRLHRSCLVHGFVHSVRSFLLQLVPEDCQGRSGAPRAAASHLESGKITARTAAIPAAGRDPGAGMPWVPEPCPQNWVLAGALSLPGGTGASYDLLGMSAASGFV